AVRAARREEARMLARAVVAEPALGPAFLGAVLEVVDGCSGPGEQTPDGLELSRLRLVRRACDRELVVVEGVVGIGEWHRLDRLCRGAQVADDVVAAEQAVARGDVDEVDRLDDVPAPHDYPERTHARKVVRAGIPRSRGLAPPTRSRRQALSDRA